MNDVLSPCLVFWNKMSIFHLLFLLENIERTGVDKLCIPIIHSSAQVIENLCLSKAVLSVFGRKTTKMNILMEFEKLHQIFEA